MFYKTRLPDVEPRNPISSLVALTSSESKRLIARGVAALPEVQKALEQAKEGRLHILKKMEEAISRPRSKISEYAPVITTIKIKPEKIKVLIGPGGKVIREISARADSTINVDDDGNVIVASPDEETAKAAIEMINEIIQEAEIGKLYMGNVKKIMDFGAFVEIFPGTDGLPALRYYGLC